MRKIKCIVSHAGMVPMAYNRALDDFVVGEPIKNKLPAPSLQFSQEFEDLDSMDEDGYTIFRIQTSEEVDGKYLIKEIIEAAPKYDKEFTFKIH